MVCSYCHNKRERRNMTISGGKMENNLIKQIIPFTQVPNGLLYNPDISFKAKGIWAYMSAKPEGWNFSADRIAEETKEERRSILSGLRELSDNGYITAKKLGSGRIEYTLHWEVASKKTPEPVVKEEPEPIVDVTSMKIRPKRTDYSSDEEFENAFYKWNSK